MRANQWNREESHYRKSLRRFLTFRKNLEKYPKIINSFLFENRLIIQHLKHIYWARFKSRTTVHWWFIDGSFMVHSWFIHGSFMVQPWFNHGSFMVHSWFIYGSFMVHSWFNHGSFTVHLWFIYGSFMVHSWFIHGSFMVHSWFNHGSIMVHLRFLSNWLAVQSVGSISWHVGTWNLFSQIDVTEKNRFKLARFNLFKNSILMNLKWTINEPWLSRGWTMNEPWMNHKWTINEL